ncbi:MAG: hypothetical protein CMJ46_04820 [Planctomyces sp.]|nr:hypothetical protein [Planctomyces sp.]
MFDIQILNENNDRISLPNRTGRTVLGEFREEFEIVLCFWSQSDYELHWLETIKQVAAGLLTKAALITSLHDPANANFITWWPLYVFNDRVLFQNQLLFLDQLEKPFELSRPFESVSDYRRFDQDKKLLSEWVVPMRWLEDYVRMF